MIPLYEHLENRIRQKRLCFIYPREDIVDEKNKNMSEFNYSFKSYPGYKELMIDDYEIPPDDLD